MISSLSLFGGDVRVCVSFFVLNSQQKKIKQQIRYIKIFFIFAVKFQTKYLGNDDCKIFIQNGLHIC